MILTRDSDVNLGLRDRAAVAKAHAAARFLSIHFNGFDRGVRGVETLLLPASEGNVNLDQDRAFATRIQQAVLNAIRMHDTGTRDRGVKEQKLGVLSDTHLGNTPGHHPCLACLLEVEFIDVEAVDKLLNTGPTAPTVRRDIATAIARALFDDLTP